MSVSIVSAARARTVMNEDICVFDFDHLISTVEHARDSLESCSFIWQPNVRMR